MLTTYIIGSLALIVKPGPDLTCTVATALSNGKGRAATLMFGLIAGCWIWILLLTAGVASFFTAHPATMTAIQVAGAVYIAYLAYGAFADAIRSFRASSPDALRPATARGVRLFFRGIAMSMANPLTILFFLAFLPSFTTASSSLSPAAQTFLLGTLFCVLVPFVYLPAIVAADFFRARLVGSVKATACLKLVSALMLAAVVAVLAGKIF
ncbi:MAG: LysE family translocator [Kiritimatiellae bacterium]|nr:LysE family translocator [Kiritimatiellia bacterium]